MKVMKETKTSQSESETEIKHNKSDTIQKVSSKRVIKDNNKDMPEAFSNIRKSTKLHSWV